VLETGYSYWKAAPMSFVPSPQSANLPPELLALVRNPVPNAGTLPLEKMYAQAIFDAAKAQGKAEVVVQQLSAIVDEVLEKHPSLEQIFGSVRVKPDEKISMMDRLFASQVEPVLLNSLKVLARHERLGLLRRIVHQMQLLHAGAMNLVRVQITTAVPLAPEHIERLRERARKQLGAEPQLIVTTNPGLIGGLTIRVGDTVYDGTLATRLANLREDMIKRTVHAIQSGRDRFGDPAGN
jgi:F-type H+-transporting ATPase subunit delta